MRWPLKPAGRRSHALVRGTPWASLFLPRVRERVCQFVGVGHEVASSWLIIALHERCGALSKRIISSNLSRRIHLHQFSFSKKSFPNRFSTSTRSRLPPPVIAHFVPLDDQATPPMIGMLKLFTTFWQDFLMS